MMRSISSGNWPGIFTLLAVLAPAGQAMGDTLVVATWGGSYERVQREVLFEPFHERTGVEIETVAYTGGLAILEDDPPDIVDMGMSEAIAACRGERLLPLDHSRLPPGDDGTPARRDFISGARQRCSLSHTVYATVIAYDSRAFPGRAPARVGDLFDRETFPGRRALHPVPDANLEWALLSHGVPRRELYNLLSTRRGLDLVFDRLDRLRGHIVWWEDAEEPIRLLESGEVVMASGFNGRFFNARLDPDSPIEIIWDGQIQEQQTWAIPAGADDPELARQFIRFATETGQLAALAERIAYGPARESAARRIGRHPEHGIDMRPHIPTHPYNSANAVNKDVSWYASTLERIRERFERWREQAGSQ